MILLSSLYMLLGIPLIIWPVQAAMVICYLLGAVCAVYGLVRAIMYFTKTGLQGGFGLALGVILIFLGVALLFAAESVIKIFSIFVGIVILAHTVLRLKLAFEIKRANPDAGWQLLLIFAIITFAIGVLLIINPFASDTSNAATIIAGIALFVDGVMDMYGMIKASKII